MSGQCLKKSLQISSLQGKYALLPVFCQCIVLKVLIVLKLNVIESLYLVFLICQTAIIHTNSDIATSSLKCDMYLKIM